MLKYSVYTIKNNTSWNKKKFRKLILNLAGNESYPQV